MSTVPQTLTLLLLATLIGPGAAGQASRAKLPLPQVKANDNLLRAGRQVRDTVHLNLEVRMATWYPEAAAPLGHPIDVAVFAEAGKVPQVPGPLIRVRQGTVIDARVHNVLTDSSITVHGLVTHPTTTRDSLVIPPGSTARVQFLAGAPGTYFYWAIAGRLSSDTREREQLSGAFVVDSAGGRTDDRIFVINIWGEPIDSLLYSNALTINGRSFPYDETITATVGDTLRWRWINASAREHPMHLHGFYFQVDAKGDAFADTAYTATERRLAVTETMDAGQTMTMVWSPDRPGNWLFHCHIGFHVTPYARLDPPADDAHAFHSGEVGQHMAGLVLGIHVRSPPGWRTPGGGEIRRLRLYVQEGRPTGYAHRAMSFVLQRGPLPPAPDSTEIPGAALVITRGQPTEVTVINRLAEGTTVHWHGLELESYSDGVAGWSGSGTHRAPVIMPGDSFVAHLTLPRAGTFIYHTHLNDYLQLTSGLYGPIVVLEPGEQFDPATDHVYTVGWDGEDDPPHLLVNGDSLSAPLSLPSGTSHRLRFVNIGMAAQLRFSLLHDSTLATWRPLAVDGADLPTTQSRAEPATFLIDVGQTADFEFLPLEPGTYSLALTHGKHLFWRQQLLVH